MKAKKKIEVANIKMVDLHGQYNKIKKEINTRIQHVINSTQFINGSEAKLFKSKFENYLDVSTVIPCANGTDAIQIALMALDLKPNDEVIVPAFTYVATAEVVALLGLKPIMVDVDPHHFNITADHVKEAISEKTKAVVPVNLFGQNAELERIRNLADEHRITMIEDNAQAIGSEFKLNDGSVQKSGTIGHIGTTSFYPSKNLGAYGDAGAVYTDNADLGEKIRMIANHGQSQKYVHDIIGCNSRLDSIQAAILNVKLDYLDSYASSRQKVADKYDLGLINVKGVEIPKRVSNSTHVFHQYTLKIKNDKRDELKQHLANNKIPSMIYYPIPLYKQKAFNRLTNISYLPVTEQLCKEVLSIPIHTEMDDNQIDYIIQNIILFFN